MGRRFWGRSRAFALLLFLAATAAAPAVGASWGAPSGNRGDRPAPSDDAPGKTMEFVCAEPTMGFDFSATPTVVYGCPLRVYDYPPGTNSGWLMGNIRLRSDPRDPTKMAMFSLHGGAVPGGAATNQSREGLTHTIYTTASEGLAWTDSWTDYEYPEPEAYGETATGTFDSLGNTYMAYLWSRSGGDGFDHFIRAFKGPEVDPRYNMMETYETDWFHVESRGPGNRMAESQMVFVPSDGTGPTEPIESSVETPGLVLLTWHESGTGGPNNWTGWIDMAWTYEGTPNGPEHWFPLAEAELIGPCREASDPVYWDHRVFVACAAGPGYRARPGARPGDVDIWTFDPKTHTTRFLAATGLNGDHPKLTANADGYFALATSRVISRTQTEVHVAMGWYGSHWHQTTTDLGPELHSRAGGLPVQSAQVTAIAVSQDKPTVFLVYKERNFVGNAPPIPKLTDTKVRLTEYTKIAFSFDECTFPVAGADFVIGTSPDVYQQQAYMKNQAVFDDVQDGFNAVRLPDGEERIYFAVTDYGAAQFGAIRVASGVSDVECALAPPPPPPAPQANPNPDPNLQSQPNTNPNPNAQNQAQNVLNANGQPAAAPAPNPYVIGAVAGVPLTGVAAYLYAMRRQLPLPTAIRDR